MCDESLPISIHRMTMTPNAAALRNRLKLRQLALLAELESAGTLHKAAERLGMSQPSATRLVHELEELMGASLFERSSRGMSPTDLGWLLMRHAAMVLTGIDHVAQEAAALRSGNAGMLRVGMFPGAPPAMLSEAIEQLKRETPRMEVKLIDGPNEVLLASLRDGGLDIVLGRAPTGQGDDAFDFELLYADHFSVVCAVAHPVPANARQGLAALVDHAWVLPFPQAALRNNLEVLFLSQCGRMPSDVIEAVSPSLIAATVTAGHRMAVLPSWFAHGYVTSGLMRMVVPRLPNLIGPIGMITRAGEVPTSQTTRLAGVLRVALDRFAPSQGDPETGSPTPKL